jgi:type VI protein secretion system component Hcp
MHTKVQRIGIAAAMTTAALLAAGPAQAGKSTITLSIGDQSSPVSAYSWGASNPVSVGSGGGGAGAGKVNVQDLSVSKETDAMTPSLIRAVTTGEHLQQVAVQFTKGVFTSSYCLSDAIVTSVSNGASARQDRPTDNVSFNFARFTFKVGTTAFAFNIVQNVPDTNPC